MNLAIRALGWATLLAAGVSVWGVVYVSSATWALFFVPLPAFVMALVVVRPVAGRPEIGVIDWGTTLGHPWIATGVVPTFVADGRPPEQVAPVRPEIRPDGLRIVIPPAGQGLPRLRWLILTAWGAACLPVVVAVPFHGWRSHAGPAEVVAMVGVLAFLCLYELIPYVVLFLVARWVRVLRAESKVVEVVGRQVRCEGRTHYLAGDTRIALDRGLLELETGAARMRIPGRADHLHALSVALQETVEGLSDVQTDVPDSLGALVSEGRA